MATKLSTDLLSRAENIVGPVKTKTEEEARTKLVQFLSNNDVNGVEDDPIRELIEMAEVFYEEPAPAAKKPAASTKKAAPVVEEEEEEEEIVDEEEEVEEETEEEEEEEEPAAASAKKTTTAAKTAAPAAKKPAVAAKAKGAPIAGEKFDARNNTKHSAYLKPFKAIFLEKDFEIGVLKNGFTVRVLGKNAKTTVMNYDELKIVDGKLIGNLYTNRFKSVDDLLETLPEEYHEKEIGMFRLESHPSVRRVSQDELIDILENSELMNVSLERANAKDVKMGINRERLEESLQTGKPTAKKTAVKK